MHLSLSLISVAILGASTLYAARVAPESQHVSSMYHQDGRDRSFNVLKSKGSPLFTEDEGQEGSDSDYFDNYHEYEFLQGGSDDESSNNKDWKRVFAEEVKVEQSAHRMMKDKAGVPSETKHSTRGGPDIERMTMTNEEILESSPGESKWNIDQLLTKCEDLVSRFEYEVAAKFCDRILQRDPNQMDALQMKASILMDTGDAEGARRVLLQCISLEPEEGHEKYLAMAQVSAGEEALSWLQKALQVLHAQNALDEDEAAYRRKQTSGIYCSIAELYMTDLCMLENAEASCEGALKLALEANPSDYEVLMTMASMRVSQCRPDEAISLLQESITQWSMLSFEDLDYPTYEFRLNTARLLVELDQNADARRLLRVLTHEDDQVVESWYLLALASYRLGRFRGSTDALESAKLLLSKGAAEEFPELADAVDELEEALKKEVIPEEDEESSCDEGDFEEDDEMLQDDDDMHVEDANNISN